MTQAQETITEIYETMGYGAAPESDSEARKWLTAHDGGALPLYINGEMIRPEGNNQFDVVNPANGETLIKATQGSAADIDKAVTAAKKAQVKWAKLKGFERAQYLYAIARLINKHARLFAVLECLDNGKTIRETRDIDIPLVIRHFYHHAGWAQIAEEDYPDYEAYGVVGQIIPWNFPLLMLAWKVAPALALGNTVVLKPAEQTPLTAMLFAQICAEAGLPAGVVNIVTGDGPETGAALTAHPDINKIAFTGSTDIGRLIREQTAGSGKALTLELGGKSPFIVFDDADLDGAVEGLVDAIWFNQGEVCCGGSRLLVQESIAERFIDKLKTRMSNLRVGNPLDKSMDMGCVVDQEQLSRITGLVDKSVDNGATLTQIPLCSNHNEKGCYYPPTLLTDIEQSDEIAQVEVFGPVLAAMSFKNQEEAIAIANNTRYGLAASIWSENINMALELAPKIKAGVIWINSTNQFDAAAGFGGMRESGYGREGGREGLFAYMRPKYEAALKPAKLLKENEAKSNASISAEAIDATPKHYIGGKQCRPDGGYSTPVYSADGALIGHIPEGNRKDIRNAVEAAVKNTKWSGLNAHARAQILYYIGENLSQRKDEFINLIKALNSKSNAKDEVNIAIERIFAAAGWCDKYDGAAHSVPQQNVVLAMNEALGTVGILSDGASSTPFLAMISAVMPALAMGNRCVLVPGNKASALLATRFMQVLETSDLPAGALNIVTGDAATLATTLADHDALDGLWAFADAKICTDIERRSTGNLKQTWVSGGKERDWSDPAQGTGKDFLRRATQVKNIWLPYGESF